MTYSRTSFQLTHLLQQVCRKLGMYTYTATGGSATTAIVGSLVNQASSKTGTLFVIRDTAGSDPEGKYSAISAYDKATGTFTIATVTTAIAAGDVVGVMPDVYPVANLVELANSALQKLGYLDLVDTTTLDSESNKTEYACSALWKNGGWPKRIDIQTKTDDANDNRWERLLGWEFIPATAGTDGLIVFPGDLPATRDIRVWYEDIHPLLTAYDSTIHNSIHPQLAFAATMAEVYEWWNGINRNDQVAIQQLNYWNSERELALTKYPIRKEIRKPKSYLYRRGDSYGKLEPSDQGKINI